MENLINETNTRLQEIIDNLQTIGREYEAKLDKNASMIESEKEKANKYKKDFAEAEATVNKMNEDIQGFESDYNHLVEKFKDDELSNILIAANREISAKIDERKKKILKDQIAMNSLVQKAESVKTKLVKLYAEKKVLEYCYQQIVDAYDYYSTELGKIIEYSNEHRDYLCECYDDDKDEEETPVNVTIDNDDEDDDDSSTEDVLDNPIIVEDEDIPDDDDEPAIPDDDNIEINIDLEQPADDDIIYIDNIDLEEEEMPKKASTPSEDDEINTDTLKQALNDTAKELDEIIDTDKDDLLNYLNITDEDLEKIMNQSDDLED